MRTSAVVLLTLFLALPILAADVDGNWTGSVSTPNGDLPVGFLFKADGATLGGSMIGPDGSPTPISNGKIDGNVLTFSVDLPLNGNIFSLSYKGVLDGEQIKFSSEFQGQVFEFVVKKVK